MEHKFLLERSITYLLCGIVITIPVVFGAVHPIVLGVYTFILFVGCGGWLLLNFDLISFKILSVWTIIPIVLIGYIIFQSIPLPLGLVEFFSPARAERISMVNQLAGTDLQSISLSESGIFSMYRSFFVLSLLFYYICLKELITHNQKVFFILFVCIIAVGTFEALYGLIQFVKPQMGILWLQIKGRAAHGSIIYKNQYASFLNMIWPLAFAGGISYFIAPINRRVNQGARRRMRDTLHELSATKMRAIILIFASVIMVLSILFSLSRGGILAMVVVTFLLTAFLPFSKIKKIIFLAVFITLIGGYGAILGFDTIISRFDSLGRSGGTRLDIYLLSLPTIADHWLTGIGLGSYTLLSPIYLKEFPVNIHYQRVHCEYIELLIELGIPMATLLFVWIITGIYKLSTQLYMGLKNMMVDRRKIVLGIAALCGLLGFLLHGIVDFGWRLPANALYAVTLVAFISASYQPDKINNASKVSH